MADGSLPPTGNSSHNNNPPNQVIHIRGDSDSELQALFDSVLKPNSAAARQQAGVPLRLRNLPHSFFNPPSANNNNNLQNHQQPPAGRLTISHSRDASVPLLDSSGGASNVRHASPLPGPQSVHFRAHSSPASLEQTLSLGQPLGSPSVSASNLTDDPLPPGWEQATTAEGRIYFINHFTRSTTWDDPRKAQHAQILEAVGQQLSSGTTTGVQLQPGGPLPQGWEQAMTAEGQVYFINHEKQTTSWFDPRLPAHMQRPPVLQQQLTNAAAAALAAGLTTARQQDQARLQQLQLERERLKMRQVEILRQMEAEQQRLSKRTPEDDPFLGDHTRQESADSGLGIAYSIPHTPENFLQETFPSSGDENMELTSGLPAEDELVPSIDLSTELLNEIHEIVAKDNMTWL